MVISDWGFGDELGRAYSAPPRGYNTAVYLYLYNLYFGGVRHILFVPGTSGPDYRGMLARRNPALDMCIVGAATSI